MAPAPASTPTLSSRTHTALDSDDNAELTQLDSIFDRIRDKTPLQPYIVSVPSGFEYHPAKILYDFRESKWDSTEKRLEYSTYLYRDTTSNESLLQLEAQEIMEAGSMSNTPRADSSANTNPNTPSLGPKKKVSLADYKKRAKEKMQNGNAETEQQSNIKDKEIVQEADLKTNGDIAGSTKKEEVNTREQRVEHQAAPHEPSVPPLSSTSDRKSINSATAAPSRKEKASSSDQANMRKQTARASGPQKLTVEPNAESHPNINKNKLSSPTSLRNSAALSNDAALATKESQMSPLPERISPITSLENAPSPTSLKLSAALPSAPNGVQEVFLELPSDAAFAKAKSDSTERKRPADETAPKVSPSKRIKQSEKVASDGRAHTPSNDQTPSKSTATNPKKETERNISNNVTGDDRSSAKPKTDAKSSALAKSIEKRKQEHPQVSGSSPKRLKTTNARTPLAATASESTTSAKFTKRVSDENAKVETPQGQTATPKTESGGASAVQHWKNELKRLEAIGKDLKRASQKTADTAQASKDRKEKDRSLKLSVVQGLESTVCFMAAFCANDQINPTHHSWRSLAVLIEEVIKRAEGQGHVQGLCFLLRAACCTRSVSILSNMKTDELEGPEQIKDHLVKVQAYVQRAEKFGRESNRLLTRRLMAKSYPNTYKASDAIPLTTPAAMPVLRMAMKFLEEWTKREGLEWTRSFEEGECGKL